MKHNVKFILEKRLKDGKLIINDVPIIAQITYNGKRIFYFTGYRIDAVRFNIDKQEVNKNSFGKEGTKKVQYNDINNRLTQIKSKLIEIFDNATIPPDKKFIVSELNTICKKIINEIENINKDIFYYFDIYIKHAGVTNNRLKSIKSYKNHLLKYTESRGINLTFENFTAETLKDFETYLRNDIVKKGDNTIGSIMKLLRTFWNYSISNFENLNINYPFKRGKNSKGYSIPKEKYGEPIYLTIDERNLIFNAEIENSRLATIRDIFVFQCLIGARVGDLTKLTKNNIDKKNILSYIPKKTIENDQTVVARIPLTPKAIEILNKYDMPDKSLLPFISDQKYNKYLKELFKFVGIDRKVEVLNTITGEKEHINICDIASSHLARRTFIGSLVNKKAPLHIVTRMSGHVDGSRSLKRYYKVDDPTLRDYVNLID